LKRSGQNNPREKKNLSSVEKEIVGLLIRSPLTINEVSHELSLPIQELGRILAMMEIEQKLVKIEGSKYAVFC